MLNCHGLFHASEVWFLEDNQEFTQRRFEIGFCPYCNNWIVGLFERSKITGKRHYQRARDKKAKRLYQELKKQIDYKKSDIQRGTKSNMGFVFGKNETVNINGKTVIFQKAVDFNGIEKVIKKIIQK